MNFTTLDPRWATAAGWLLTYLLHSTLLLGLALVAQRALRGRLPALEERIWKVAIVAGLVTASLALGPTVAMPASTTAAPVATAAVEKPIVVSDAPAATLDATAGESATAALAADPSGVATTAGWAGWLLALWATGTLWLLSRFALAALLLRGRLARRLPVAQGPLARLLGRLARRAALRKPVGLSTTDRLAVPCALGFPRPEVCLPRRAVESWSTRQQETVLAHEIAHLAHRDPHWLVVLRLIEAVFFLQPLNRWASARLEELAERRCDDWAVRQTGRPVELARCLTEVAEWITSTAPAGMTRLPVPGMASGRRGAALRRRIEHLLAADSTPDAAGDAAAEGSVRRSPRAAWFATALVLVAVAWVAPTFGPTAEAGEGAATAQDRAQAAEYRAESAPPAAAEEMKAQAEQLQRQMQLSEDERRLLIEKMQTETQRLQERMQLSAEQQRALVERMQAEAGQLQRRLSADEQRALVEKMQVRAEELRRQHPELLARLEREGRAADAEAAAQVLQRMERARERMLRAQVDRLEQLDARQLERTLEQAMAADRALLASGASEGLDAEELAARRAALDRKVAELHRRLDEMAERLRSELTEPPVDD